MAFQIDSSLVARIKEMARDVGQIDGLLPAGHYLIDDIKETIDKFDATTGHTHAGTSEDGPQLDIDNMSDVVHTHSGNPEGGTIPNGSLDNPNSYFTVSLHCSRQLTATVDPLFAFQMPTGATLIEASCFARSSGGTSPTLTIDIEDGGISVGGSFPQAVTVGAANIAVATPAAGSADIADNSAIEVVATVGGTTPTWDDITVAITFKAGHVT